MILSPQAINIESWYAWAPDHETLQAWQDWSRCPKPLAGDGKINAKSIPTRLRRRYNDLTRAAVEVSICALKERQPVDYAVFCSQHGDLSCVVNLLEDLSSNTVLSPMQFVQSVHNASAGLVSMIEKMQQNMNAIAAGEKTFLMGVLEAISWLRLYPKSSVLVTMYEGQIPLAYHSLNINPNSFPYAIAIVLSSSTDTNKSLSLEVQSDSSKHSKINTIPLALEFLAWWLQSPSSQYIQHTGNQKFIWQRQQ